MPKFTTSFKSIGTVYDESIKLLELLDSDDWNSLQKKIFDQNLLKKRSSRWISMLCSFFERRYLQNWPYLPESDFLINFVTKTSSHISKTQTLYQYICKAHPFIDKLIIDFIAPNFQEYARFNLTKDEYFEYFEIISKEHSEVRAWADYTKQKMQRDFFAFLRQSGLMEGAPSMLVSRFDLQPEVFTFFAYNLLEKGIIGENFFRHQIWKRFFLSHSNLESLLSQAQLRGWISFQISGKISEITPRYQTLEDWLNEY